MSRVNLLLALIVCSLMQMGCGSAEPPIDQRKMRIIVWDMLLVEAYHQQLAASDTSFKYGSRAKENEEKVFQVHGINRQQYMDSYKWYLERPEEMRELMDSISTNGDRERAKIYQKKYGGAKPSGS